MRTFNDLLESRKELSDAVRKAVTEPIPESLPTIYNANHDKTTLLGIIVEDNDKDYVVVPLESEYAQFTPGLISFTKDHNFEIQGLIVGYIEFNRFEWMTYARYFSIKAPTDLLVKPIFR